jgi:hypothetical protein
LQEAAAAAIARAEELEARAAAQSKTGAHSTGAHSGAISLGSSPGTLPPQALDSERAAKSRGTMRGSISATSEVPAKRRHLPTATELPAQTDDSLGDPTVTFSPGAAQPQPPPKRVEKRAESTSEYQAVPEQIIGERSGTYSMKRQSPTQRVNRRQPTTESRRSRTGPVPIVTPQPPPARSGRRAATGKAANPEPGRPRSPVVVSRPAVIIGAPPKMVGKGGGRRPAPRKARGGSVFGKDLISEKSLDEVIMAYLSEDSSEE